MLLLSKEELLARLNLLPPTNADELSIIIQRAMDEVLKTPKNKTGYHHVDTTTSKKFQARPYINGKGYRNLGTFETVEEAAKRVILAMLGENPIPPTPKERNKRGEGRRQRDRRKVPGECYLFLSRAFPFLLTVRCFAFRCGSTDERPSDEEGMQTLQSAWIRIYG